MTDAVARLDEIVAQLSADGQPFALDSAEIDGVSYRNYASMPATLRDYYPLMLGHADKTFLVYDEQRLTFAEVHAQACALAQSLRSDYALKAGDRVAIVARNTPQWMVAFIAITSIGGVAVPMNAWWTAEELEYGFRDSGARIAIVDRQRAQRLAPLLASIDLSLIAVEDCGELPVASAMFDQLVAAHAGAAMPEVVVAPDDNATIMYTSGSTGHPKGALSSHRGVVSALYSWMLLGLAGKMLESEMQSAAASEELPAAGLLAIPLFHCTASHSAFLLSLVVGRKLVLMRKWDAQDALRLIEAEKITWITGVPTMTAELQAAAQTSDRDISSLKDVFSGGAARPAGQVDDIVKTFKGSNPGSGYGMTETNALAAVNSGALYVARPGSTGRVVPAVTDIEIRSEAGHALPVGERGEVCIKSPANCRSYWNKPEATAEAFVDGWFHTGDVGYFDEQGFLYIVDRIKDIIIRGGENISCIEVETAIDRHPAIAEVAVFGLPDERLGEIVGAAVVVRPDAAVTDDELRDFLAQHIAAFKIPAHIWIWEQPLPRIASGKIFKRQLKADYAAELAAGAA